MTGRDQWQGGTNDCYRFEPAQDVAALAKPDSLTLLAMRWWVRCHGLNECPLERLTQGLGRAGVRDAAYSVDGLMRIIARTGQNPVDIIRKIRRRPRCPGLSDDEAVLPHDARLAQEARSDLAQRHLRDHLLTEAGAAFAIGPSEGLGSLFLAAGLAFGRLRRTPAAPDDQVAARVMSEACTRTIH